MHPLPLQPTVAAVFAPKTRIARDGTIEGYASLFGEIDQARDMVVRGAFAETLRARPVQRVPMLFQHDPSEPVGVWLELREDHRGLYARGRLIPDVKRARELLSLLDAGAIDGLSIGFRAARARIDPRTRVRSLLAVDLWEISIVTFPLLAGARVRSVKEASSPPRISPARARACAAEAAASSPRRRAEAAWGKLAGAADGPAPAMLAPRRRSGDGGGRAGRIRAWRAG